MNHTSSVQESINKGLILSVESDCIALVKYFIDLGADINSRSKIINGINIFEYCMQQNKLEIFKLLSASPKADIISFINHPTEISLVSILSYECIRHKND